MYIPFRGGEQIEAVKVTAFQIGTPNFALTELREIPDFTSSSKLIKNQYVLILAEVREELTAPKTFNRFTEGIQALEETENNENV